MSDMRSSNEVTTRRRGPFVSKRRIALAVIVATLAISAALTVDHAEPASASPDHSAGAIVRTTSIAQDEAESAHIALQAAVGSETVCVGGDLVLVTCSIVTTVSSMVSPERAGPVAGAMHPVRAWSTYDPLVEHTTWAHADQPDRTALRVIRT